MKKGIPIDPTNPPKFEDWVHLFVKGTVIPAKFTKLIEGVVYAHTNTGSISCPVDRCFLGFMRRDAYEVAVDRASTIRRLRSSHLLRVEDDVEYMEDANSLILFPSNPNNLKSTHSALRKRFKPKKVAVATQDYWRIWYAIKVLNDSRVEDLEWYKIDLSELGSHIKKGKSCSEYIDRILLPLKDKTEEMNLRDFGKAIYVI